MSRVRSWNAFETALNGAIDNAVTTITLVSVDNLSPNTFLVIDPDTPSTREYVYVLAVDGGGKTVTVRTRPEQGSTGGTAWPHADGAVVRSVPVHQWLDEIFDDIEANALAITNHIPGTDPHPQYLSDAQAQGQYVQKNGDTMSGPLVLPGSDPTQANQASRKAYVDGQVAATLTSAQAYADAKDHDHATPIAAHAGDPDVHHPQVHAAAGTDHTSGAEPAGRRLVADGSGGLTWADSSGGGVTDHGGLVGLGDDDHTQYLTQVRGDVRYYTKAQIDSMMAGKAAVSHTHPTSAIVSGTFDVARIPNLSPSKILAGSFGAGTYTFPNAVVVGGGLYENSGVVEFKNLPVGAGQADLRWNSSSGAVSRQ
jgi:hypothetical protein